MHFSYLEKLWAEKSMQNIKGFCTVFKEALYMLVLYDTLKSLPL